MEQLCVWVTWVRVGTTEYLVFLIVSRVIVFVMVTLAGVTVTVGFFVTAGFVTVVVIVVERVVVV